MDIPRFDVNGDAADLEQKEPDQEMAPSINLGGGNLVIRQEGVLRFWREDRELFSVDANTVPFEKKLLAMVLQVYVLGISNGRQGIPLAVERIKQRLNSAIGLVFE